MSGVIKRNPLVASQGWEQVGKQITWLVVAVTNIANENGTNSEFQVGWEADGAVNALMAAVQNYTTVIAMGPLVSGVVSIAVEGIFSDQLGLDGVEVGDLARMQVDIRSLGTVVGSNAIGDPNGAGADLSAATVTAKTFILA